MYMLELQNRCVKFGVNGQRAQIINVRDNETLEFSHLLVKNGKAVHREGKEE
jgi:hypothetical protein